MTEKDRQPGKVQEGGTLGKLENGKLGGGGLGRCGVVGAVRCVRVSVLCRIYPASCAFLLGLDPAFVFPFPFRVRALPHSSSVFKRPLPSSFRVSELGLAVLASSLCLSYRPCGSASCIAAPGPGNAGSVAHGRGGGTGSHAQLAHRGAVAFGVGVARAHTSNTSCWFSTERSIRPTASYRKDEAVMDG
jgi:hypothetical protein